MLGHLYAPSSWVQSHCSFCTLPQHCHPSPQPSLNQLCHPNTPAPRECWCHLHPMCLNLKWPETSVSSWRKKPHFFLPTPRNSSVFHSFSSTVLDPWLLRLGSTWNPHRHRSDTHTTFSWQCPANWVTLGSIFTQPLWLGLDAILTCKEINLILDHDLFSNRDIAKYWV